MSKDGPDVVNFTPGDPAAPTVVYGYYIGNIHDAAERQYRMLADAGNLAGLPREEFVTQLGERWAELNFVHSFREGNTRAQVVFFDQLTRNAGYALDRRQFTIGQPLRDEFVNARFYSMATGRSDRLAAVLDKVVSSPPPTGSGTTFNLSAEVRRDRAVVARDARRRSGPMGGAATPRPIDITDYRAGPELD